jgi:hypothetical protein
MASDKITPITAGELQDNLRNNADWAAAHRARELERATRRELIKQEQSPIIKDLNEAGVKASTVSDLVNRRTDYSSAFPILVRHLRLQYSDRTLEMIARSLATPEAETHWDELFDLYRSTPSFKPDGKTSDLKNGLAVALSVLGRKHPKDIIALCFDPFNGPSRVTVIQAIRRKKGPLIDDALRQLLKDPEMKTELSRWNRNKI